LDQKRREKISGEKDKMKKVGWTEERKKRYFYAFLWLSCCFLALVLATLLV